MNKLLFFLSISVFSISAYGQSNPNFTLHTNGVTCLCSKAAIGETGTVYGVVYTKRTREQITTENAATTCTSGISDMSFLFDSNSTLNEDISTWDVSSVTNMYNMFSEASTFNQPIGNWNVNKVVEMTNMFYWAESFNQDLSKWCVSQIPSEPNDFTVKCPLQIDFNPKWGQDCETLSTTTFSNNSLAISFLPNPFSGSVKINLPENITALQVEVINSLGQTVYTSTKTELNLEHLSAGMYFVKVNTNQGIITEKIIKN